MPDVGFETLSLYKNSLAVIIGLLREPNFANGG
ncbi:MAG: hypothetical protein ACFWTN_05615 [Clostridium sp.]|jgi:hypothetical protein